MIINSCLNIINLIHSSKYFVRAFLDSKELREMLVQLVRLDRRGHKELLE